MKLFGSYKKRSRSASLQLSINAIVILVMAMAVLGLGLGLIRGVLGKGKDKLTKSIDEMDIGESATAEKVIANANAITLVRGKPTPLVISYYSTHNDCNSAKLDLQCYKDDGTINENFFSKKSVVPVLLNSGEASKIGASFTVNKTIPSGSHGCNVIVNCTNPTNVGVLDSLISYIEVTS